MNWYKFLAVVVVWAMFISIVSRFCILRDRRKKQWDIWMS